MRVLVSKYYVRNNMSNWSAKKTLWSRAEQSKRFRAKAIADWRAGSSARCRWCYVIWVVRVVRDRRHHAMPTHHPNRIAVVYLACQRHRHHRHWTVCQHLHHRRHWIGPLPLHAMSHKMTIIITVIMTIWARTRIRLQSTGKNKMILIWFTLFFFFFFVDVAFIARAECVWTRETKP